MAAVWPQMVVEESNLAFQIGALRRVLDRGRTGDSCIQTVTRRGYRFAPPVRRLEEETVDRPTAFPRGDASSPSSQSIIVLPFANLSSDPEQQHFADGITEDLTTDLQISGLFVIGSRSAFVYNAKLADPKQLRRELGVHYVLHGSVRRLGSRVRMNVQLTDTETEGLLWAERFEIDRRNDRRPPRPDAASGAS